MTFFSETNQDATTVAPDQATSGPLVGFFGAWNSAVDAQMRASSQFGIEYFMHEQDWAQTKAMLDAGVENPPQLILQVEGRGPGEDSFWFRSIGQTLRDDSGYYEDFLPERSRPYVDTARLYTGGEVDEQTKLRVQEYDKRVEEIRKNHPELTIKTSREMFEQVRTDAQKAEARESAQRRTWGGSFGGFLGGAVSSLHPGTDPLNFYTLGIGGAGKTALARIAVQTGAQGVVETINQVTGVQEEREMLGLSHGFGDAAMRVGGAMAGAAFLQGAGEAVAAAGKRWFRATPNDPAPAPEVIAPVKAPVEPPARIDGPAMVDEARTARLEMEGAGRPYLDVVADQTPLSGIRAAKPRVGADLADVARQMDDWASGPVAALRPRTSVAAYPGDVANPRVDVSAAVGNARVEAAAREVDPALFRQYDALVERKNTYKRWLDELSQQRDGDVQSILTGIETRLDQLEARHRTTQGKTNKLRIREEIASVKADRDAVLKMSDVKETPDIARVRRELVKVDEKMRDLAPMLGRAYARARGKWGENAEDLDAVWAAYRAGKTSVEPPTNAVPDAEVLMSLYDRVPVLRRAKPEQAENRMAVDVARDVLAEETKVMDAALEAYRSGVRAVLKAEDGKLRIDGSDHVFDLDKDKMFMPDGREVTLREMAEELDRADQELEAITTCSIR